MKKFFMLSFVFLIMFSSSFISVNAAELPNHGKNYYVVVESKLTETTYTDWLIAQDTPIRVHGSLTNLGMTNADRWRLIDNTWTLDSSNITMASGFNFVSMKSANHDVYVGTTDTVFFSKMAGLIPILEEIPMMEKMLLPIAGILPFLIPFLVLLVAFWKGWQFLLQQLRTA